MYVYMYISDPLVLQKGNHFQFNHSFFSLLPLLDSLHQLMYVQ